MDSTTREQVTKRTKVIARRSFPRHGWAGLVLIGIFWPLNWLLEGVRTAYAFFPLWLGYSLLMDALAYRQNGSSLLSRSWKAYVAMFIIASPGWWLFEAINLRVQNWEYLGRNLFGPIQYFLLASLNFSVVMPAVFGAAEWFAGMGWIQRMRRGPIIRKDRVTTSVFFVTGWIMAALMLLWPRYFFPFVWLSIYFIIEPINVWLGNRTLADATQRRDWRPVISLFVGALFTGFFWELWNYFSFPKWIYHVPGVDFFRIFEMPLLGYGGYLPFSLELHALYFFVLGLFAKGRSRYLLPKFAGPTQRESKEMTPRDRS